MAKGKKKAHAPPKKVARPKPAKKVAPRPVRSKPVPKASTPSDVETENEIDAVAARMNAPLSEHLLTMSFLRDEGEFCVRLERSSGTTTELKNRSPDLLLRMVAGELEDLLG